MRGDMTHVLIHAVTLASLWGLSSGGLAPPSAACLAKATEWCNSPKTNEDCLKNYGPNPGLIALDDRSVDSDKHAWRCYSPECLTANKTSYDPTKNCTGYCTRPVLGAIVSDCMDPAPPPANATNYLAEVFVPGELGYPCIRIPSILLSGDNSTLLAFAECRNWTGDGCIPKLYRSSLSEIDPETDSNRDICLKRSVDGGRTWGPLSVIARNGAQPSPVWDAVRGKLIFEYTQLSPGDTMQMESEDHGVTWTKPISVCADGLSGACGGAIGPGVGIQLTHPPYAGRILFIGHFGAYVKDRVWYSDDGGKTFNVSPTILEKMDEAQLVELPDGSVLANMRNAHLNSSCDCRGISISKDGGQTFGPITYDPTLISPVCMGSVLKGRDGNYFFANPASKTGRVNGKLRWSKDGVVWTKSKQVWPGSYAYSCLTNMPNASTIGLLWETDGDQCIGSGASCRTVFSVYPSSL